MSHRSVDSQHILRKLFLFLGVPDEYMGIKQYSHGMSEVCNHSYSLVNSLLVLICKRSPTLLLLVPLDLFKPVVKFLIFHRTYLHVYIISVPK